MSAAPPDASDPPENAPAHERLHSVVHGMVQGVGFRMAALRAATALGLTGWVKNTWEGTVETVAEGPRAALDEYARALRQGSRASVVERVDQTFSAATSEFSGFNVRY